MMPESSLRARPTRGTAHFTTASVIAAAARGLAVAGFLTTPLSRFPPWVSARWFLIPLLYLPGAFAPRLARSRRARALIGPRNVTSLYVLAGFFRGGLVCTIPWAR